MRKEHETYLFHALGIFETLGSKISHGTSWIAEIIHWIISPNVRTHLRKVFNMSFKLFKFENAFMVQKKHLEKFLRISILQGA